jgi:hypothetical protein
MLPSRAHQGDAIDSVRLLTTDKVSSTRTSCPREQRRTSCLTGLDTALKDTMFSSASNMEAQISYRSPTAALGCRYSRLESSKQIPVLHTTHLRSTEPVSANNRASSTTPYHHIPKLDQPTIHHRFLQAVNTIQPNPKKHQPPNQPPTMSNTMPGSYDPTSCATEPLSRRHHYLLPVSTVSHATQSNPRQMTNGADVLCAGEPNFVWCSGGV